jgi:hypothetical protein
MPIGQRTSWGSGAQPKRPPGPDSASQPLDAAALVDRCELQRFFEVLFRDASDDSFVSLRIFDQHDRSKLPWIEGIKVGDTRLIDEIEAAAIRAARALAPAVFAPPVSTFNNLTRARRDNLVNGLAIAVDLDKGDTGENLKKLEYLIGPATVVVRSGGSWTDPATGKDFAKRHVYWRLSEPTNDIASHNLLILARHDAALLVGADLSGASPVHPFRWPGSVHTKDPAHPVPCRIERINEQAEVHLEDAAEKLGEVVNALGLGSSRGDGQDQATDQHPPAELSDLASALDAIPVEGMAHIEWVVIGMALHNATGGAEAGLKLFDKFSQRSPGDYDRKGLEVQWRSFANKPTGKRLRTAGTIYYLAQQNGWRFSPRQEPEPDPKPSAEPKADDNIRTWPEMDAEAFYGPAGEVVDAIPPTTEVDPVGVPGGPLIEIRPGETERIVDEIEAALLISDRHLYRRGGFVVAVGVDRMQTWDRRIVETQIIEERGDHALLEDFEAVAQFHKFNARAKKNVRCSPGISLVLAYKERRTRLRLPNLVGVVNCPSIRVNGDLVAKPGFDAATGILFDPLGVDFPPVPENPTKALAESALKRIKRLLRTFPFVIDPDRAVALSLILTAIARPHLPSAPLHGFDAPLAGSGKSKLVDIASILANGHEAGVIAQGETREETEKRLSTLLMRGDPLIAVDNCELPLEGDLINQALTQTWVNLRILGQSQAVKVRCASLITATGNNLTLKGDVTRRSLVSRLDPKCERPELKQFDYDPIADAKENRGQLVADALTILRAYQCAGRPNSPPPLQGFIEWSNTIRASLIWLGEADPVKSMDRLRETDPVLANLKAVLTAWRDEFGDASTTTNDIVGAANGTQATSEPGTFDRLRDALLVVAGRGGKIETRKLGQWLGKNVDRVVDLGGGDLVVLEPAGLLHGAQQWRVVSREPEQHEQAADFGFSEGGLGGLGGAVQATQAKMSMSHMTSPVNGWAVPHPSHPTHPDVRWRCDRHDHRQSRPPTVAPSNDGARFRQSDERLRSNRRRLSKRGRSFVEFQK